MNSQDEFIAQRREQWSELDALIDRAQSRRTLRREPQSVPRMATLYRALCADVAIADRRAYSDELRTYLERLAARAHATLHTAPPFRLHTMVDFVARGFPRSVRAHKWFVWIATALFALPLLFTLIATLVSPSFASSLVPEQTLRSSAESYQQGFDAGRPDGQGVMMTGHYVRNNVGIAFRCFATGALFGLGSVFFLLYNGAVIGTVLGFVAASGAGRNISSFVITHGAFELTAIVIAGAAGLVMGDALIRTGGRTRLGSLSHRAGEVFSLVMGAALMLFIAALIEGLWSGSSVPAAVKYTTGAIAWTAVLLYLLFAGRERSEARP